MSATDKEFQTCRKPGPYRPTDSTTDKCNLFQFSAFTNI